MDKIKTHNRNTSNKKRDKRLLTLYGHGKTRINKKLPLKSLTALSTTAKKACFAVKLTYTTGVMSQPGNVILCPKEPSISFKRPFSLDSSTSTSMTTSFSSRQGARE